MPWNLDVLSTECSVQALKNDIVLPEGNFRIRTASSVAGSTLLLMARAQKHGTSSIPLQPLYWAAVPTCRMFLACTEQRLSM